MDLDITAINRNGQTNESDFALPKERAELLEKVQSLLGLARRARHLQLGLTAVTKLIAGGEVELIFVASDLAEDSKRKLHNLLASKEHLLKHNYYCCNMFTRAELSAKLDSERAVLALPVDGFSQSLKQSLLTYKELLQANLQDQEIDPSNYFSKLQAVCRTYTKRVTQSKQHKNKLVGQHEQTKGLRQLRGGKIAHVGRDK
ncbi:L7Ae/L30e/S12e/Gadd45 family ribosomal protein [Amygdalobacter nucleatus]|uniref:L7Ae/L30e/S12e/Gadd45 family ribosomal protein n=1 Tax=Amygdalobacter nucleatus TaxID=3029274 RepID=UPI00279960E0|nr:ribosomal L7Ae/L30e/S12e/Gadd45 family protein [Amygdalobacter nucleatus]WEG36738.1 ribosomal L7Ae/L30e/S12e/Gadd45 family protein [Amygdalobacter nucleatus]